MKAYEPEADPVQGKFMTTRKELSAALIERDDEVDVVLTALVAQEHVLLVDVPVREMPRIYRELKAPLGKTDVVFLTDAVCRLPADVVRRFLAWKAEARARLITLVIQSGPGDLAAISDEVHLVGSLGVSVGRWRFCGALALLCTFPDPFATRRRRQR
jgi:hypothetical protein